MYIEPNTNIRLLHNVPLDNTYEHTIYFSNATAQFNYFSGLTKYSLINYSYQRVQRGRARVGINAESLYDCNYMMFQNAAFGTKWFYAFITGVEYVNDNTTEISFEIDVMQTWFFDYTLEDSFVEREHSATDEVGDNILDENLNLGKYVFGNLNRSGFFDDWCILVQSPYTPLGGTSDVAYNPAGKYSGVISGVKNFVIRDGAPEGGVPLLDALQTYLDACNNTDGATDAIVTISMFPEDFLQKNPWRVPEEGMSHIMEVTKPTTLGNYTPKNKKLLTYPYNYLAIRNGANNITEYRYELFNYLDNKCGFKIYGDANTISFTCVPMGYNHSGVSTAENFVEINTMTDIPLVSYPTDTYKIWYSQNKVGLIGNTALASIGSAVAGLAAGGANMAKGLGGSVGAITAAIIQNENHKHLPNMVRGTAGSGFGIVTQTQDFCYQQVHINEQHARVIDDYFSMFGYATRRLKKPNRNVRPHWTFTKTTRVNLTGSVPSDDMKKLCSIYDSGITFWRNGNEVGNYSLDNSPT